MAPHRFPWKTPQDSQGKVIGEKGKCKPCGSRDRFSGRKIMGFMAWRREGALPCSSAAFWGNFGVALPRVLATPGARQHSVPITLKGGDPKNPSPGTSPAGRAAVPALAHTQCHHLSVPACSWQPSQGTEHRHQIPPKATPAGVLGLGLGQQQVTECLIHTALRDGHGGNRN